MVTESGSDISAELAQRYNIQIVPMHVTFGNVTKDDGAFPPEEIYAYYERTGTLPKTSGSTPEDFKQVFGAIHSAHPQAHILYMAYSAATTVSYQSAMIAAEDLDYVTGIDTKHVSVGLASVVVAMAQYLEETPGVTVEQAVAAAKDICGHARMCFIPNDLEYLRAGGRISNVVYFLGGQLLHLHPRVELLDGRLVATKKYRGDYAKVIAELIRGYSEENRLRKDHLWMLYTERLAPEERERAEAAARACGFERVTWLRANGVITTHGGPGAFAMAGQAED